MSESEASPTSTWSHGVGMPWDGENGAGKNTSAARKGVGSVSLCKMRHGAAVEGWGL